MIDPRKIVLDILIEYDRNGTYANLALKKHLRVIDDLRDKKFITALVYGVIDKKILLDYYISKVSSVRLKKINKVVLNILRMGLYQMRFMSTPESAACNTSVALAKTNGQFKSAGFVNAILRKLSKTFDDISLPTVDTPDYFSVKYSVSEQIVDILLSAFGTEGISEFFENGYKHNCTFAAVNLNKTSAEELINEFKNEGITAEKTEFKGLVKITDTINVEGSSAFKNGLFHIIGFPSYLAAIAAMPLKNQTVIDMCSAPGGKTFAISYNSDSSNKIYAFDVHDHKIKSISENCTRLGVTNVYPKVRDGSVYCSELKDSADVVLCDVPCSGLGIIFKKPDIKYKNIDFEALTDVQFKILTNASEYVKPSGRIVYSTCTVNPSENKLLVEKFLENNQSFYLDTDFKIYGENCGNFQFMPNDIFSDGFYIAVISKK